MVAALECQYPQKVGDKLIGIEGTPATYTPRRWAFARVAKARSTWKGVIMIGVLFGAAALAFQTSVPAGPSSTIGEAEPSAWTVVYARPSERRFVAVDWRSIDREGQSVTYSVADVRRGTDGQVRYSVTDEAMDCKAPTVSQPPATQREAVTRVVCEQDLSFATGVFVPEIDLASLARGLLSRP